MPLKRIIYILLFLGFLTTIVQCTVDIEHYIYLMQEDSYSSFHQVLVYSVIILFTIPIRRVLLERNLYINERIFWLVYSFIYATLVYYNIKRRWLDSTWNVSPHQLLAVFMPISLFKTAYSIDLHMLKRSMAQVLLVGILGTIINASIVGLFMMFIIVDELHPWGPAKGYIFGTACITVEVSNSLRILNDFEKYKHLVTVLEGEELFGAVTALCMFQVAVGIEEGYITFWYQAMLIFMRLAFFGAFLGGVMGLLICWIIRMLTRDAMNVVMLTIVGTFLSWYISEYLLAFSGCITCTVVGFCMAKEKSSMSIEVDAYVNYFWNIFSDMVNAVFFVSLLGMIIDRLAYTATLSTFPPILVTYIVCNLSRFASLLIMAPALSRSGYGMSFKSMLLIVWSNTKGTLPMLMGFIIFHYKEMHTLSRDILAHVAGLCITCLLINGSTLGMMMKMFGFTELSIVRKSNMNNCMKYLHEKREGVISILKMNRFLSDANWPVVNSATMLHHPYKLKITNDEEDAFLWGARDSICPECHQNIPIAPTMREIKDMTIEARLRVLKTQRISYIRQYESGMLSKVGIRSLLQAVEVAMDSTEPIIKLDDYFKIIKKKHAHDFFKNILMIFLRKSSTELKPPRNRNRRFLYYVLTSKYYIIFMHFVTILTMANLIIEVIVHMHFIKLDKYYSEPIHIAFIVLLIIYVIDALIKIEASSQTNIKNGLKLYLSGMCNVIDIIFINLLIIKTYFCYSGEKENENILTYCCFIRAFRLFNLIHDAVPRIIRYCENRIDMRIMFAYDVGKALVTGYEESIDILSQMVENKTVRDNLKRQIEDDRLAVTKELGLIQKYSPWIAISIKTKQATRATLNHMREAIADLKTSGFVDDFEYDKLRESVEESLKQARALKIINMSSPKLLFREIQWMGFNQETCEYLYENVNTQIWDAGDVICKNGRRPHAILILVTGLFRISYTPDHGVLKELSQKGALPIIDYISSCKFEESVEEFIFSGNSMGELSMITNRPYNSTVVAEAPSQAYILSNSIVREAMEKDKNPINGLEARLWKYISVTLACEILQETPAYQSFTQEQVRLLLVRSFVPNLSCYKIFVVNELIQDIVLIEGIVMDYNTREIYVAPCYIPRTVQKIIMPDSSLMKVDIDRHVKARLLFVPGKDVDELDIMDRAEELSELVPNPSMSCLVSTSYGKRQRKRKKNYFAKQKQTQRKTSKQSYSKVLSISTSDEDWTMQTMAIQVIEDDEGEKKNDGSVDTSVKPE